MPKKTLLVLLAPVLILSAQTPGHLEGDWRGVLDIGIKVPWTLHLSKAPDGLYFGRLVRTEVATDLPTSEATGRIEKNGNSVRMEIMRGTLEGTISPDATRIRAAFDPGRGPKIPIDLVRAEPSQDPTNPPAGPPGLQVGLKVSVPPVPFLAGGKTNLVYELDLTNYSWVDMQVERLDVLDGDKTIANFAGYELSNILTRPRLAVGEDHRVLPVGGHVVAFLWLSLDPAKPAPSHLRHRIVVGQRSLEGGEVAVSTVTLKSLGPPLRGSDWLVGNGFANDLLSHRRSFLVVEGKTFIAQRFAIDWQKLDAKGRAAAGPDNKDFFGYGNEVLAVSDGIIAEIKDGIPQNIPGPTRAAPMTIETIAGNHILLDLGDNRFALYAHLQPGSLRVSVGDRVRKGTVLGLVGNSGNSGGPHLHFHITDGPSPFASEGVPYALEEFEVLGGSDPGVRRNEAPLNGELIRFSESK